MRSGDAQRGDGDGAAGDVVIRSGNEGDEPALLTLFDEAVAWLVARGQTGQWGSVPFSERPERRERVHEMAVGGGLHIAEREREPVGALVVGQAPVYAGPAELPELYVLLLLSSRRLAGHRIGAALVGKAIALARDQDAQILRVDCWAGAPPLIGWYESQGFVRSHRFELGGWQGQVLNMELA